MRRSGGGGREVKEAARCYCLAENEREGCGHGQWKVLLRQLLEGVAG